VEKNRGSLLIVIFFGLAIYLLPMFPHGGSPEELTRWATAASIVEKGSFDISWTDSLLGETGETCKVGERIYAAAAPGAAVLSAPFYALTRLFVGAPPDASNIRVSWFVMRFFTATLPLLLLAYWLYRRDADEFSLAALIFASPVFLFSLLFFAHVLAAVLVYLAFRVLYDERNVYPTKCFWGGLIGGFALATEYAAAAAVVMFGLGLFFTERRFRSPRFFWFMAGALPPLLLLAIYNSSLFGSPIPALYAPAAVTNVSAQSGFGFPWPQNILALLFSPSRGLFFFAPVLLLAVAAFFTSREGGTLRHNIKILAVAVSILVVSGFETAGARHLIFVVPLLLDSVFDGETDEFPDFLRGFLLTISFLLCALPVLTFPFAPPESAFPHNDFWKPLLFEENWFAPNLANVFGLPNNIWTILPAVALLLFSLFIVWQSSIKPKKFLFGIAAACAAVGIYVFWPHSGEAENVKFARAALAEQHFRPANRLQSFKETALAENDWTRLRKISALEWEIAAARSFAPNDFPYLETRILPAAPDAELRRAADLRRQGNAAEAEAVLLKGKQNFPFARCEFAADLAAIYNETERSAAALAELEAVQPLVNPASRPECLRAQFLLGSIYRENGRTTEAEQIFRRFLENSQNSDDKEIKDYRQLLGTH
jgi:hypothetical protein